MQTFDYELVYPNGRRARGHILAKDSRQAVEKLKVQECKIVRLQPRKEIEQAKLSVAGGNKTLFMANLNLRLAGQLKAGIALRRALDNISRAGTGSYGKDLQAVCSLLDNGIAFSDSLAARPVFPDFMVAMVRVAEATGTLADILQDVADYYFELYELQMHLKQIAIYPLFLCTIIIGMLFAFIVFVVPSFASLYSMLNIELHGALRGLLFIKEHLLLLLLALAVMVVLAGLYLRRRCTASPNYLMDLALSVPLLRGFVRTLQEVRFCRVMSMQLMAGVDLLSAMATVRNCVSGSTLQGMLDKVTIDLTQGMSLYEAGKLHNTFLSADTLEFIAVGEDGNGYAQMLHLAHLQASLNMKNITASLRTYLQPVIFLLTALALGSVIIVLLQPMLGVLENIGNNW